MRHSRALGILLAAGMAAGCAAVPPVEKAYHTRVIETWVGSTASALWLSWGPPARQLTASNGMRFDIYTQRIGKPAGVDDPALNRTYAAASDPDCLTYFAVDPKTDRIQLARWRGTTCQLYAQQTDVDVLRSIQPTGF
ncbi:MAG: hypothetical protein ACPHN2_05295 [Sinimarinibacterium flocculans]|uniref:hypothetical protein n=1 Tax=Sinimarinibacterium flocculans TaxID=985250 RepID=UPI003C46B43A